MPLNTGIGVVAPWSYIAEMINDPQLVEKRMATIKQNPDAALGGSKGPT
jgi:hypothetical protein